MDLDLKAGTWISNCHGLQNAQAGGPLKGAAFWNFLADGQQAPAAEGGGSGLYGIKVGDSTFGYVRSNAALMRSCVPPLNLSCMLRGDGAGPCERLYSL